jgi:NifU-like protein involved in Fe-S cluster formation
MISDLYQKSILALAAAARGAGRLAKPTGSADVRNPLCGDHVIMDVHTRDGRIEELGHELKACVVCQASASLLAQQAAGSDASDLSSLLDGLKGMLKEEAAPPGGKWAGYADLAGVAPYGNRHRCVTLPVEATLDALKDAEEK